MYARLQRGVNWASLFVYLLFSFAFFFNKKTKHKKTQDVTARLGEATLE
jgi:hypothetical protein